jgi:hypothetical protein
MMGGGAKNPSIIIQNLGGMFHSKIELSLYYFHAVYAILIEERGRQSASLGLLYKKALPPTRGGRA